MLIKLIDVHTSEDFAGIHRKAKWINQEDMNNCCGDRWDCIFVGLWYCQRLVNYPVWRSCRYLRPIRGAAQLPERNSRLLELESSFRSWCLFSLSFSAMSFAVTASIIFLKPVPLFWSVMLWSRCLLPRFYFSTCNFAWMEFY